MDRSRRRGAQNDRFEAERAEFFQRVRRGYLDIAAREPARMLQVDASRDVGPIAKDIRHALQRLRDGAA
jgi:dTMP kinase